MDDGERVGGHQSSPKKVLGLRSPFHISNLNVLVFSNKLLKSRCKSVSL